MGDTLSTSWDASYGGEIYLRYAGFFRSYLCCIPNRKRKGNFFGRNDRLLLLEVVQFQYVRTMYCSTLYGTMNGMACMHCPVLTITNLYIRQGESLYTGLDKHRGQDRTGQVHQVRGNVSVAPDCYSINVVEGCGRWYFYWRR
jgi:hypothetical protein